MATPQRFLGNNRNLLRDAVLSASSVLAVSNKVLPIRTARTGTGTVSLTGDYAGAEQADYDIEILDNDAGDEALVSTPVFKGVGGGTIDGIVATNGAQSYTVELRQAGTASAYASVAVEGVTLKAAAIGPSGNDIRISVDQSGLTFTSSQYSLLAALPVGAGSAAAPMSGPAFDWDAAVLDANGLVPTGAHRVAFGDDESAIYLSFKQFVSGAWQYRLAPALTRAIPQGTAVKFVTGGRTVTITDGVSPETYPDVVTAYDFLNAVKTRAAGLTTVDGVVANDRGPTGQAARELALRTDAHAEPSTGAGSAYATGFTDVSVASGARTELIVARCYAVTAGDHPLARLGSERWTLDGTLSGSLGTIVTGKLFESADFNLRVPVKLPPGFGAPKGRFQCTSGPLAVRSSGDGPPVCPVGLKLGPEAVNQTITLTYKTRPTGECECAGMPVPDLETSCLGNPTEGGGTAVSYESDTVVRLAALRLWFKQLVRSMSAYNAFDATDDSAPPASAGEWPAIANPIDNVDINNDSAFADAYPRAQQTDSIKQIVDNFEAALAQIDPLEPASPPGYREAGCDAWDDAVLELQTDISDAIGSPPQLLNVPSSRYSASLAYVLQVAGISPLGGADANILESGDGCWRDLGDAAWFEVTGSVKGAYAPLFVNRKYWACRKNDSGKFFSTHEFALQVNVVPACAAALRDGDTITLVISDAGWGASYQVGDTLILPIIASGPIYLTGGATGAPTQYWYVTASIDGALAVYAFNPDAPIAYAGTGIAFLLHQGGTAFAVGARFGFSVEGGHYRWRKNGGAWVDASPPLAISATPASLDAGLSIAFATGASASFVAADVHRFRALQPWAVSHAQSPKPMTVWRWGADSPDVVTLDADLGTVQTIDTAAFIHSLPDGATLTLDGGAAAPSDWSEPITVGERSSWKTLTHTARYVRLTITNGAGGSLAFAWLGQAVVTDKTADWNPHDQYSVARASSGLLQGGHYLGKGVGGDLAWTILYEADVAALRAMVDHAKANDDEPILFIPQTTRTTEPLVYALINGDEMPYPDRHGYQRNLGKPREMTGNMALAAVWQ